MNLLRRVKPLRFQCLGATAILVCGLLACGGRAANKLPVIQDGPNVIGDWTGESICQVKNSPCHDEKVVYHVTRGKAADLVECSADKIVDGKAVNMGTLVFKYDKEAGTLVCDDHGHWQFTIKGNKMEGTLTLADGTLYRKIALTKN